MGFSWVCVYLSISTKDRYVIFISKYLNFALADAEKLHFDNWFVLT